MPWSPELQEVQDLLETLKDSEGDEAQAQLLRVIALRETGPLGTFSDLHRLVSSRREAWRGPLEGAFVAAGLPLDPAGLLTLLRADMGPVALLALELLARQPEAAAAARTLMLDDTGEWMDQQGRWYDVAHLAEAMGPERGSPVLQELWAITGDAYRDVHFRIGRTLFLWGEAAVPFLLARLDDDPRRAMSEVQTLAHRWGARHEDVRARVQALAEVPGLERAVENTLRTLAPA